MRYPMINKQQRREVNVPELSGGLNLRDSLTGVRDNQIIDCINMWYKDGMLQSRPEALETANWSMCSNCDDLTDLKVKKHNIEYNGKQLITIKCKLCGEDRINAIFVSEGGMEVLPALITDASGYFCVLFESKLYCYTSNREIFMLTLPHNDGEEWSLIASDDIYVPIYITNGRANKSYYSYEATMLEGINIIGNKLKYYYSTVNPGVTNDGENIMLYKFPIMKVNWISHVKATVTDIKGEMTVHEMDIDGSENVHYYESKHNTNWENVDDGLEMIVQVGRSEKGKIEAFALGFRYSDTTKGTNHTVNGWGIIPKNAESIENNLEVIVTYESIEEDKKAVDTVFAMSEAEWFGGASVGINGGTRLFLGGNTNDDRKSLIVWSALNDPLYFPENNYAYIGEKDTAVTGFGKQSDMLVIFKESETYYTQYVQNNDISGEDIINQTIVDYQANCVYFPLTLINSSIGCDCPDTIQLCRNRLVWINSSGKIYSLVSNNQYSERNIYEVGQMIKSRIMREENLKKATSCDWDGHYVVFVDGHIYLMNYNSSGYQSVSSYQSNEDANIRIPWYYWEICDDSHNAVAMTAGNKFVIAGVNKATGWICNQFVIDEENSGNNELMYSAFTTKLFDFSAAGYLKNIDRVGIAFGNNGSNPINVSFVTDKGIESDVVSLVGSSTNKRDAEFVKFKNLYPCIKAVRTFGVKVECEGPLVVDGLSLQYRLLGGVK